MHNAADLKREPGALRDADIKHEPGALRALTLGLALGVVLVYCLLMYATDQTTRFAEGAAERNTAMLTALADPAWRDDVRVVVLGNSRLRYAMDYGFDPAQTVDLPDGRKMHIVQYAENVAMFEQYAPLWPYIIQAHPDLVVLVDMLVTTRRRSGKVSLSNFSSLLNDFIRRELRGDTPESEWDAARHNITDSCLTDFNSRDVQDRLIFAAHRDNHSLTDNENAESARSAIRQARMAGIPVAILRFPSNHEGYDPHHVPADLIDYFGLGYVPTREQLLPGQAGAVAWLEYPAQPRSSFCDFVHFNRQGRTDFSNWLRGHVAALVPRGLQP